MARPPTYERSRPGWPSKRAPAFYFEYDEDADIAAPRQRTHAASIASVRGWSPPSKSDSGQSESTASDAE